MPRVYCPLSADDLDALAAGGFTPASAFAVTGGVRALVADGDEELYEHLATQFAAAAAVTPRVLVAALDVPDARVTERTAAGAGVVTIDGPVTAREIACYLLGDEGERVTDDADLELSWYDAGEREEVRHLM